MANWIFPKGPKWPDGSSPAPPAGVWHATTRPAAWVPSDGLTLSGDSWTVGVGAVAPAERVDTYITALLPALAVLTVGAGGMALNIPAGALNTNPIPDQVANQGAGPLANSDQFGDGGINDSNSTVVPLPATQFWAANALNGVNAGIYPVLTGGASQLYTLYWMTGEETNGPGMKHYSDWTWAKRQQRAARGADLFDFQRYLQSFCDTNPATLDYINVQTFHGLPLTFRGVNGGVTTFPSTPQTVLNTCVAATNDVAGVQAVAPAAGFAIGSYIQNNNTAVGGNNLFRRDSAGVWNVVNEKHPSLYLNQQWAQCQVDILAAKDNQGATFGTPAELYFPQDAAAGTIVGTIYYYGPSPDAIYLFDAAHVAVSEYTLTDNGSANNRGSITVRRSATGIVAEGFEALDLQLECNGLYQHSIVDVYVGRPSTQTTPQKWTLPNSAGVMTPASHCSIYGRQANPVTDGALYSFAFWFNTSDLSQVPVLYSGNPDNGSSSTINIGVINTGRLRVTARNGAGTLCVNRTAVLASAFPANTWIWLVIDIDNTGATDVTTAYYNIAGTPGDIPITFNAGILAGPTTLEGSKWTQRFLSNKDACITYQGFADPGRNQFRGGIGNLIIANGLMGVANPAVRALLWDPATGNPTPRVPYTAIGAATVRVDVQGGIGDLAYGGFDPNNPLMWTRHTVLELTPG